MYYSVQSSHFDNYLDNSKTAYFALRRYTSGLKGEQTANLKLKVTMLVGGIRVPPTIGLCFWPVKRNGFWVSKPTIFMTRESAGIRRLRAGFWSAAGEKDPPELTSIYKESENQAETEPHHG
jgi:hypothetical protein